MMELHSGRRQLTSDRIISIATVRNVGTLIMAVGPGLFGLATI